MVPVRETRRRSSNWRFCTGRGRGVARDDAEAFRWYLKAADQNHPAAQYNLGVIYDSGIGVPQDYTQAVHWYRKAAEQGDAGAQFNLGVMYASGAGVSRDDTQAVHWYRKAAEQGHAGGQFNLGSMYANNTGVSQDYAQASSLVAPGSRTGTRRLTGQPRHVVGSGPGSRTRLCASRRVVA